MMPGRTKRLIAGAIIAAVLATALVLRRPSVPEYEVTDLGSPMQFGHVKAINNKGQVVGWTITPKGQSCAIIWDPVGGKKLIPVPDRRSSYASDINDKGQVVGGLSAIGGKQSAFVWDRETGLTELGTPGGDSSVASAINNNGQVAGWIEDSKGKRRAFFWDKADGMQDLGTLGGAESFAHDINDKGQVVGRSFLGPGQVHGFIWDQDNGMVDIGALGPIAHAQAINNSGQVVGTSTNKGSDRGFIWEESKGIKELDLPGQASFPMKINDSGQVIGWFATGAFLFFKSHEYWFLWDPEQGCITLDAISQLKGALFKPVDINNKGQIVGIQIAKPGKGQDRVIILTPKAKSKTKDQ